ncbi:hypothetical protein NE237_030926 [Protea cynaroides]|uniref:Uncharacterized protein n=1 Tax=Protea cynaroides TaxID=273540 RepID=A0A9Q0JVB9_9MAGN|nr:hypothetical protein NE237_030926 [Protea cynaroides]
MKSIEYSLPTRSSRLNRQLGESKDIRTAWDHYANFSDVKWKIQPNDYKPTSLVIYHDWWQSSDSRLNSFQACYLPDGPLFKSVAVTSCANSPAALKDGGLSEVEVPEANTPICCSSSSPCSREAVARSVLVAALPIKKRKPEAAISAEVSKKKRLPRSKLASNVSVSVPTLYPMNLSSTLSFFSCDEFDCFEPKNILPGYAQRETYSLAARWKSQKKASKARKSQASPQHYYYQSQPSVTSLPVGVNPMNMQVY